MSSSSVLSLATGTLHLFMGPPIFAEFTTTTDQAFTPNMPAIVSLNFRYRSDCLPRRNNYEFLCPSTTVTSRYVSALATRQADMYPATSVVALFSLLLLFLSPTKLLSLSLTLSRVHRHPLLSSFSLSQIRLSFLLFCYFFFLYSPPAMSLNPPARNASLDKRLVGRLPH